MPCLKPRSTRKCGSQSLQGTVKEWKKFFSSKMFKNYYSISSLKWLFCENPESESWSFCVGHMLVAMYYCYFGKPVFIVFISSLYLYFGFSNKHFSIQFNSILLYVRVGGFAMSCKQNLAGGAGKTHYTVTGYCWIAFPRDHVVYTVARELADLVSLLSSCHFLCCDKFLLGNISSLILTLLFGWWEEPPACKDASRTSNVPLWKVYMVSGLTWSNLWKNKPVK